MPRRGGLFEPEQSVNIERFMVGWEWGRSEHPEEFSEITRFVGQMHKYILLKCF